jgi:hypothetical protein
LPEGDKVTDEKCRGGRREGGKERGRREGKGGEGYLVIIGGLLTLVTSLCLRKVRALVISSSLASSEYMDSFTLSMHQSNPTAKEDSITGAMSLAAVRIVLSASAFRPFSIFLKESPLMASMSSL